VVPTGWGGWVEGFLPAMLGARAGSAVLAFALPE
jgi:alcohol dehydrogenase (cytochrome c)